MAYGYRPRGMPVRFMEGAPDIVRNNVLDILAIKPATPLDFDVLLRSDPPAGVSRPCFEHHQTPGIDFGKHGTRGQHFFLNGPEMRAYRERNRRNRVAWRDLPERTQLAIVAYLESDSWMK